MHIHSALLFFLPIKLQLQLSVLNLMDFFLVLNLTNPILTYKERRLYRFSGPPNLSHPPEVPQKIFDQEGYSIIFFLGPQNENALPLQKK